ncbi:MAG: hypothetical protein ABJC12_01015 [Saprospiraceae bacterium]
MKRTMGVKIFSVKHCLVLTLWILHEHYRLSGSSNGVITMTRKELSLSKGSA